MKKLPSTNRITEGWPVFGKKNKYSVSQKKIQIATTSGRNGMVDIIAIRILIIPNDGISGIYIILLLEVDEPFRRWCSSVEKVYAHKINNSNRCLVQKPVFVRMDVYMSTSDAKLHMLEHVGNDCANLQSFWQLLVLSCHHIPIHKSCYLIKTSDPIKPTFVHNIYNMHNIHTFIYFSPKMYVLSHV